MNTEPPRITVYSRDEHFIYVGPEWSLEHSLNGDIVIKYNGVKAAHFRRWESYHAGPPELLT